MAGLGCGCGCNGEKKKTGVGCIPPFENMPPPVGVEFEFGLPMGADGVPISSRLPGYEAVTSSMVPSLAAGGGLDFNGLATKSIFGCPLWVVALAGAIVFLEKRGRR